MSQEIECRLVPDPQGHGDALLLKGDWLLVHIRDGKEIGRGEASHSGNDQLCMQRIQDLFERFVKGTTLSLENIKRLEQEAISQVFDFVSATAFSGINQALYELLAVKEGVPVWQLLRKDLACSQIPVYATINRALTTRTGEDYLSVIHRVRQSGLQAIKCAPFEAVEQGGDQVTCSHDGLHVLETIRNEYPDLNLRIDFHQRFHCDSFLQILPRLDALSPYWLEEPCEYGPAYESIAQVAATPLAAGELYCRHDDFEDMLRSGWVTFMMPDVKYVGGFGPLVSLCQMASRYPGVEVSLHNPSGPIATLASLHAAAISPTVTSMEIPLWSDHNQMIARNCFDQGCLYPPHGVGWGMDVTYGSA